MSSRVELIRKRVAVGATALLAVAFGAVTTWGRQAKPTSGATGVLQQEQQLAAGTDDSVVPQDDGGNAPAPLTTRQS